MSERGVRQGGLMRCCIQSVIEYDGPELPGETIIPCFAGGHDTIRLAADGIWEWDHE